MLLLSEFSNEVVPEDGSPLEERYPTMAEFQVMSEFSFNLVLSPSTELELIYLTFARILTDRAVALAAGSRYLTDADLDFDRVLRESGKFTDIHVFRIDAQVGERGVGELFHVAGSFQI